MFDLLLFIIVANSAPVVARNLLGARCARAIDGGRLWSDARPVFGASKTWRGLVAAVAVAALVAPLLDRGPLLGALSAALAMLGDLAASFVKRRRGYAPSDHAPGLDTVPEALLPALLLAPWFELAWWEIVAVVALFHACVRLASPVLFRLHVRRHPW